MDQNNGELNVDVAPTRVEVTFKEIEVLKLKAAPDETLVFKFMGDVFTEVDLHQIGLQLRKLFPDNKVVVLAFPDGSDMQLTVLENQDKVETTNDCSKATSYCNDCSCGKKERIEGENGG